MNGNLANSQNCFSTLNIPQSISNGNAIITHSTLDIGNINLIFDNNSATLARSASINPLVVTASFTSTIYLDSVLVEQSYSSGWFTLECANTLADLNSLSGSYQLLLNMIPTTAPNTVTGLPVTKAVSASSKIFRLSVRRTTGDNFVHLNEWKLFGTYFDKPELGPNKTQLFCPTGYYADISKFFDNELAANPGYSKVGWFNNQSWLPINPALATWGPTYALIVQNATGCRDTGLVNTVTYPTLNIMNSLPQALEATREIDDSTGWTHYIYSYTTGTGDLNEILLLSINKNGYNIGELNDGILKVKLVATAGSGSGEALHVQNPLIQNPAGFYAMHRYWQVVPTSQPGGQVGVRYYFTNTDLLDMKGSVPFIGLGTQLNMYKTEGGNPSPATNLAGAIGIKSLASGSVSSVDSFKYTFLGCDEHMAEFKVVNFSGGGGAGSTFNGRAITDTTSKISYTCGNTQYLADKIISKPDSIKMYPGWKVYLNKPGYYQVPKLLAINGTDTTTIPGGCITWSVGNQNKLTIENNVLIAKNPGHAKLNASLGSYGIQIPVEVKVAVLPEEKLPAIDNFLVTPAACHSALIPVLVLVYLPTKDGINYDTDEIPGYMQTLTQAKQHSLRIMQHTKFSLEEGSKFRGYKNPAAKPYLGYKVVDYIYVYEPLPLSIQDNPNAGSYWVDYYQITERHRGKYYVDTLGVKEIWLMGYHTNKVSPLESNMSSRTTGNISNSYRREDDLPKYDRTYIMYNYNITRGGNEATHNHGHQIETMVDYAAFKQNGNTQLFSRDFRGYTVSGQGPLNRCGDTHHPPNSRSDYDYNNSTLVASDIMDWKPSGGTQTMVNNATWANIPYAWPTSLYPSLPPNMESNWYIFWMQSIPGNGNQISHGTKYMTNWWRFKAEWDSANTRVGLYQDLPEQNLDGCAPGGITYTFIGNGKWSDVANWENRMRPPNPMPPGHKVVINHVQGGSCIMDIPFKIFSGMNVHVNPGNILSL